MAQQQEVLAAFVEFADTLVDDHDVVEFLHRLARRCVDLMDASDAGVMLTDRDGTLQPVASSSERTRRVELGQLRHNQGPSVDAYRTGVAVHSGLASEAGVRWPAFVPDARAAGYESVSVLPMRLRSEVIGVIDLFSHSPVALDAGARTVAQGLADIATIGILQGRALHDERIVTGQLEGALKSRIVIEQAKGLVAERFGLTMEAASSMMRNFARSRNRTVGQTATDILAGNVSGDAITQAAPPAHIGNRS